jgi:branched-chain amino acid transport system substrate-binding protein
VLYPWRGIKFDPKSQQNIYATGTLVQIQDEQYVTVWPFEAAAKDVVWPFPAWRSRK